VRESFPDVVGIPTG